MFFVKKYKKTYRAEICTQPNKDTTCSVFELQYMNQSQYYKPFFKLGASDTENLRGGSLNVPQV